MSSPLLWPATLQRDRFHQRFRLARWRLRLLSTRSELNVSAARFLDIIIAGYWPTVVAMRFCVAR
jgi:hypothetical protein